MTEAVYKLLTKPRKIRGQIKKAEAEMEGLKLSMLPGAIRYDKDKVQASPQDPMAQYAVRLDELERKIGDLQTEYLNAQDEVVAVANELTSPGDVIITLRFISGWDFQSIAKEISMSERQMFRYYKVAQEELTKRCQ